MSEDMPWVIGLTDEEVQELRSKKQELTEYGKEKIRKLMSDGKLRFYDKGKETLTIEDPYWGKCQTPKTQLHIKEMTHEEMLEIAAQREAENKVIVAKVSEEDYKKVQEEIANKKALEELDKLYDENGDALQQLAAIERQELIEKLEAKKKENFQLVADACMKEYEQKYGRDVFPVDEYWVYMIAEYFGTGEGQTVCIMMTQANPGHPEDFEFSSNKYVPCTTKEYRAVRKFHEKFGTWMLGGLRFLSREDFFSECSYYIPPVMMKLSNKQCYKEFYTEVHYNFS